MDFSLKTVKLLVEIFNNLPLTLLFFEEANESLCESPLFYLHFLRGERNKLTPRTSVTALFFSM